MTENRYLSQDDDAMALDSSPQRPEEKEILPPSRRRSHEEGSTSSRKKAMSNDEEELLREYCKLLSNLRALSSSIGEINSTTRKRGDDQDDDLLQNRKSLASLGEISDSLQRLERKMDLVFTLMKASVYNIFLQQGAGFDPAEINQYNNNNNGPSSSVSDFSHPSR